MSIPTPYLLAIGLSAAVAGWMLSGDIVQGGREDAKPATISERKQESDANLFRVQAEIFRSAEHVSVIEVRGSTEASDNIAVRTETTGLMNARHVVKGERVKTGQLICTLNVGDREALVAQRMAELNKAELDFQAAQSLEKSGYATSARLNENRALLDAAKAQLKSAEIELARTSITAPIDGIVQDPYAKAGDMLQVGDVCATVMQPETMTMIAQVSERYIGQIRLGEAAEVATVTGQTRAGEIRYVAPSADANTRTFRIEIALPNSNGEIRDGVTAIAKIELPGDQAHLVPASALSLNDAGVLGVRTVDEDGMVSFVAVRILEDTREGSWVSGLPETVRVITRGQEFVIEGQKVEVVLNTAEARS
ncbi:MAG: efflux RND transporter periplasmic adaptor subunit [Rhizobiales bacterium]|nr:efflux RND transporter periplasmic adaptor subunit [Hyphomicrobiales bacterium]